ncbi:paramyosin [Mobula hypostoma]|uniref:paramyosin n=1 Tax=Mobula hypostoma TaxID=723540 RepID=UPI002FC327D6
MCSLTQLRCGLRHSVCLTLRAARLLPGRDSDVCGPERPFPPMRAGGAAVPRARSVDFKIWGGRVRGCAPGDGRRPLGWLEEFGMLRLSERSSRMGDRALGENVGRSDSGLVKCGDAAAAAGIDDGGWWRDMDLLGAGVRKSALSPASGVRQNMKHLLSELKDMYEEKLRHMGNKDESKDTLKMKVRILQSYVNDLGDQNKVLVQTIEDLEKEANEKIANLDTRLRRDDQLLTEQQLKWEASKEEIDHLRGENMNVKIDLSTLVCAIQQAEKSQKFDFSSLNLRSIQLEKVASPAFHSSIIRKKSEISEPLLGGKFHLETNDMMGRSLHEELKDAWCDCEQSELEPEVKEHRVYDLEAEHQNGKTQAQRTSLQNCNETDVNHKSFQQVQHKIQHQEMLLNQLRQKYLTAVNVVENQQRMIHSLEQDLQTAMLAGKEMATGVAECEETIKHLEIELSSLHSAQELDNKTITQKKQVIHELHQESNSLKQKLKEALCKIHQKESKICVLEEELLDARKQYSVYYEEFLHREKFMQKLKEETVELTDQIKKQSQDISALSAEKQKIELEMTVITEKYRTAQQEVSKQDEIILKLKTDLKTAREKYGGAQKDIGVQTAELNRLAEKLTNLQHEVCKLRNIGDVQQERLNEAGKSIQEFEHERKMLMEEVGKHEDTIKKEKSENMHLRKQIELLQNQVTESHNQALTSESTADLYKQKYQTSTDRIHHLENHVQNLKEESNHQIAEKDEEILQVQSCLTQYRINHGHSNEEYDGQVALVKHLEKELELMKSTCNEKNSRIGECEQTILDLREEITKSDNQQKNCVLEVEKLEQALENLNLNAADSENKHKLELVQLQKQITQLESNLADSQKSCNQMHQAIWERDDLLQKREAELLESQENVRKKMSEMKVLDNIVTDLQIKLQNLQFHKIQTQNENTILRAEIQQLNQELQGLHQQYREKVQELANREEKLILLESNLQATEKQLNNQTSEVVHQEQKQQTLHMQIRTLKKQLETTEEEMNKYKQEQEELRNELNMIKQQQEIVDHHDDSQSTMMELGNTKDQIQTLRQQIKEEEIAYLQNKYYNICLELMKEKSQVKDLQLKLATEEEKLEAQKQALEAAQSDNNRLQEESELMVSSVKEWITEQGHANNILGTKIQQQNQLVSRLTMDKVCLQETIKDLNQELKKVKTEMEEKENKTEQLKALQSHGASQQILPNQLGSQLKNQEYEWANLIAEKVETIEDMHNRLKTSVQSMQLLHQQLHTLDRENLKHESQLEEEQTHRHQLELQLETLGQTILSLRTQLKSQRLAEDEERRCQKGEVIDSRKEWAGSQRSLGNAMEDQWKGNSELQLMHSRLVH